MNVLNVMFVLHLLCFVFSVLKAPFQESDTDTDTHAHTHTQYANVIQHRNLSISTVVCPYTSIFLQKTMESYCKSQLNKMHLGIQCWPFFPL